MTSLVAARTSREDDESLAECMTKCWDVGYECGEKCEKGNPSSKDSMKCVDGCGDTLESCTTDCQNE